MPATQWTKLNTRWLFKQLAMAILFTAFGVWGYIDATVIYPARGVAYAEYMRFRYLDQLKQTAAGPSWGEVAIADPVAELARLRTGIADKDTVNRARLEWLEALDVVGKLSPTETRIDKPQDDFAALEKKYNSTAGQAAIPKQLQFHDIPVQWLIFAVCTGIGLTMFGFAVVVARVRYGWNPEATELTLPGGATLNLSQIEDFDRRKWDKFLMFVKVKPGHPSLPPGEIKLDLLRFVPLEEWVVTMEYALFPDRKQAAEEPTPASGPEVLPPPAP